MLENLTTYCGKGRTGCGLPEQIHNGINILPGEGLLQKQDNLTEWLNATPLSKKKVLLGPSTDQSVHDRLDVIDDAISKADLKTLGKCEVCHEVVETELLEVDYTACVCIEHLSKEERLPVKEVIQKIRLSLEEFSEGRPF